MSNPNDLVIVRRGDVEDLKQEAIFGVFRRDAVEFDKLNTLLANAPVVSSEPVAYTDGKEDFMSVATYEEYKKLGFFTKCNQPLYTTPQQPQSVADALEEFAKEIKGLCNDYSSHKRSVYIGDVESDIDELLKQHLLVPKEGE